MLQDHEGNPINSRSAVLYVQGQLSYQEKNGTPHHPFDLEGGGDLDENGDLDDGPVTTYLHWTGRVTWSVTVTFHDNRWADLYFTESAAEAVAKMREIGATNEIEVDDRLHIPGHNANAAETDIIRQDALESMGPKFFIAGDEVTGAPRPDSPPWKACLSPAAHDTGSPAPDGVGTP